MTVTLALRTAALRDKLTQLDDLSSNAQEASNLSTLRTELSGPVQTLSALVQRQDLLIKSGVPVQERESLRVVRRRADGVRERFRSDRKSSTLKKGTAWKSMLTETDQAAKEIEQSLSAAWKEFRSSLFSGDAPGKIDASLARTPENIEALKAYRALYETFTRLFQTPPASPEVVDEARRLAAELVRIAGHFDFDVAPDVKRFLEAVQAGGAPLSLLTPEVVVWLQRGQSMDGYRIRAVEAR